MANITAARLVEGRPATDQINYIAMDGTDYWRGGAVCKRLSGAEAGRIDRTMDGSVHAIFAGLMIETMKPRDSADALLTQAQLNARKDLEVKLRTRGTAKFVCASFDATNFVAEIGRRVWFTDDQTVSLTPPSDDYPLCAGRVVDILSATECEVNIEPGVGYFPNFQKLAVGPTDLAGVAAATDIELITDYLFDRRVFVREVSLVVNVAIAGAHLDDIIWQKDAAATSISGMSVLTTGVVGAVFTGVINSLFEQDETLSIIAGATGEVTGGEVSVIVRYLPID